MRRACVFAPSALVASTAEEAEEAEAEAEAEDAAGVPGATHRDGDFLQFWLQPRALLEGASPYDPA